MYLNPYYLLELLLGTSPPLAGEVPEALVRQALAEFGFAEDGVLEFDGTPVHKSQARTAFEELRDPERRRVHGAVYQNSQLQDILTQERAEELLDGKVLRDIHGLNAWDILGSHLANLLGRAFLAGYQQAPETLVRCLDSQMVVPDRFKDGCFGQLYGTLRQTSQEAVQALRLRYGVGGPERDAKDRIPIGGGLYLEQEEQSDNSDIQAHIHLLNALPGYFQPLRNELGQHVFDVAHDMCHQRKLPNRCWYPLLELADSVNLDGDVGKTVAENLRRCQPKPAPPRRSATGFFHIVTPVPAMQIVGLAMIGILTADVTSPHSSRCLDLLTTMKLAVVGTLGLTILRSTFMFFLWWKSKE